MSVCRKPGFEKIWKSITLLTFPSQAEISVQSCFLSQWQGSSTDKQMCRTSGLCSGGCCPTVLPQEGSSALLPWDGAALPAGSPHSEPSQTTSASSQTWQLHIPPSPSEEGTERRSWVLLPAGVGLPGAVTPPQLCPDVVWVFKVAEVCSCSISHHFQMLLEHCASDEKRGWTHQAAPCARH